MKSENIIVKHTGVSYTVKTEDILYIESNNKKVIIHTLKNVVKYYGQIDSFEGTGSFFRCHRCFVVNMQHIFSYSAQSVVLTNGKEILMSRRRYPEFERVYMDYLAIQD